MECLQSYAVDMGPGTLDLIGVRAGDLNQFAFWLDQGGTLLDLSGYSITSQARKYPLAGVALSAVITLTSDPTVGLARWDGDEVRELLGQTDKWTGIWDLQVQSGGDLPVTVIGGRFVAVMDVTR